MSASLYPTSPEDAIRRWDAGESVWSIEVGGLGPGYEQAIQVFAIEIVREYVNRGKKEYTPEEWELMAQAVLSTMDDKLGGLSGAQFGAAAWVSHAMVFKGWEWLREQAKKRGEDDRWIQVSKAWPRAA